MAPKRQIRVLGIDDGPFTRKDTEALVVGTVYRGGDFMDGVLSTSIMRDGDDATDTIIAMIRKSKWHPIIQYLLLNGIAVGGFNVIDVRKLAAQTGIPVIVVVRRMPDLLNICRILKRLKMNQKVKLIEQAGELHKIGKVWVQLTDLSVERAAEILRITCSRSDIPEPIRIAHIIAAGVVKGESRGRA